MRSEGANDNRDHAWPGAVQYNISGGEHRSEVLWRCDALRAGKLYSRSLFGTREEAEQFVQRMQQAEPDHMFSVESIKASAVWN